MTKGKKWHFTHFVVIVKGWFLCRDGLRNSMVSVGRRSQWDWVSHSLTDPLDALEQRRAPESSENSRWIVEWIVWQTWVITSLIYQMSLSPSLCEIIEDSYDIFGGSISYASVSTWSYEEQKHITYTLLMLYQWDSHSVSVIYYVPVQNTGPV